jgi:hypothetical protein
MESANESVKTQFKPRFYLLCGLFILSLAIGQPSLMAQDENDALEEDKLSIGFVGGASMNSFNFNGISIGTSVGAYFKYKLSDALDLQPELKYSMLGGVRRNAWVDYSALGGNVNSIELFNRNVQINTVDIPVLLRISPRQFRTETFTPRIIVGGYFAYAFDLTEQQDKLFNFADGTRAYTSGLVEDVTDYYEQANYGFIVGLGLEFTGASNSFGIDLRYRQGINQSSLVGFAPEQYAGSIRMSSISLDFTFEIFK